MADGDAGSWKMETHQIKGSLRPRRGSEIIEPSPRSVAASTHQLKPQTLAYSTWQDPFMYRIFDPFLILAFLIFQPSVFLILTQDNLQCQTQSYH